jgi:queuine/archaeosine tRNA-ribosyltransferase
MGTLIYSCAGADANNLPSSPIDSLLINVLDHGSTPQKINAAKKMLRKANAGHSIGDSSGYQLHEAEKNGKAVTFDSSFPLKNTAKALNISPQQVMEANAIHQPDIVIGLDWPVLKVKSDIQKQLEFYKKLKFNVTWAFESSAWKNALIPGAQYFQPLQAYNLDHVDIFLNEIHGVFFDGISMPVRNIKPAELALFLVDFYRRGITRVHLLGTASLSDIVLCAYAAWNLFEWVSLDSTTWRFAADKESFINPLDLSRTDLRNSVCVPETAFNLCPCPFCSGRSFQSIQTMEPRRDKVRLLREHNWLAIANLVADLYAHGDTIPNLEKELRFRCRNQRRVDDLINILSVVDALKDCDISLLQTVLASNPTGRRQTRLVGRQTRPEKRPRKTTKQACQISHPVDCQVTR